MPLDPKQYGINSTNPKRPSDGFVLDVFGPGRSGKNDFACSIAEMDPSRPTVIMAMDYNYRGPMLRWRRQGYKFIPLEYFYSLPEAPPTEGFKNTPNFVSKVQKVADICRPVFNRFRKDLWEALSSDRVGGIIIDNGTQLYKLCRYAVFGYVHKVPRNLYPRSTNAMSTIVNQVRYSGKNVCWIHRETEIWGENEKGQEEPTGEFERMGAFKELSYEVMATLHSEVLEDGKFRVEVLDSTFNAAVVGKGFRGKNRTFKKVCAALTAEDAA